MHELLESPPETDQQEAQARMRNLKSEATKVNRGASPKSLHASP